MNDKNSDFWRNKYLKYLNKYNKLKEITQQNGGNGNGSCEEKKVMLPVAPVPQVPTQSTPQTKLIKEVDIPKANTNSGPCSVGQWMNLTEEELKLCNNSTLVYGSCGDPSFMHTIEGNGTPELGNLFQKLLDTTTDNQKLAIVVGAILPTEFNVNGYTTVVYIDPSYLPQDNSNFRIYDNNTNIKSSNSIELDNVTMGEGKIYYIGAYFPLNIQGEININIINKIMELQNKIHIGFYNKMCGTCFRSFWYIINYGKNITYYLSPAQGTDVTDHGGIVDCFKDWVYTRGKIYKDDRDIIDPKNLK